MAWEREAQKPLYDAIHSGNLQEFRRLLQQYPDNLRTSDERDLWLHVTARDGLLPFVELLVDLGVGVDEQDATQLESETALTTAAGNGHLDVVRWLLDHGAKLNYERQGRFYCPALIGAAIEGHLDVVRLLVERGADINGHTNGMNALMQAEMYGQSEVYEFLQSHGARDLRATTPPDFPASHRRIIEILTGEAGQEGEWTLEFPGEPAVTVHCRQPDDDRPWRTLFTTGLSDLILHLPNGQPIATELRLALPADWPLSDEALADPVWNWPVEWLRRLVDQTRDSLKWPQRQAAVFMNGDPPGPLAPDTELCGWICLHRETANYQMPDYRWIDVRDLYPIYREEQELVASAGDEELLRRFEAKNIPRPIDPQRPNVAVGE